MRRSRSRSGTADRAAGRTTPGPVGSGVAAVRVSGGQAMVLVRWRSYLSVMVKLLLWSAGLEVTATLEPLVLTRL